MFHRHTHNGNRGHGNHAQGDHPRGSRRHARSEHGGDRQEHAHGRHGRGGRGGLGRFFAHGDLRLVILQLIAGKPGHGYEIIKDIEERVGGAYSPSPGVIYPTLTLLEELGYVTVSVEDGGKKLHTITEAGQAFLLANRKTLEGLLARMAEAAETHGGGTAPPILRGMENVKLALRMRLARGKLNEDQTNAVAAALDAAATAIEQT